MKLHLKGGRMKLFTFYVDREHPQTNLIFASAQGDLNLEKWHVTADTIEEAKEQLMQQIFNPEPEEEDPEE
jgi:hypothetical protein